MISETNLQKMSKGQAIAVCKAITGRAARSKKEAIRRVISFQETVDVWCAKARSMHGRVAA